MALSKRMEELAIEMRRVDGFDKNLAGAAVTWLETPEQQQEMLDWIRQEEAPDRRTVMNKIGEIATRETKGLNRETPRK